MRLETLIPSLSEGVTKARLYKPKGENPWEEVRVNLSDRDVASLSEGEMIFLSFLEQPKEPLNSRQLRITMGKRVQVRPPAQMEFGFDLHTDPGFFINKLLKRMERELKRMASTEIKRIMESIRMDHRWQQVRKENLVESREKYLDFWRK